MEIDTSQRSDESLLWTPTEQDRQQANVTHFMRWLEQTQGLHFNDREELWRWSVSHVEAFWSALWSYFDIRSSRPYSTVLSTHEMPGAHWFSGAYLNYAEQVFRDVQPTEAAILFHSEREALQTITWEELQRRVASVAQSLRALGVQTGDRVVAYLPNIPEAVIAFLACASIGAIWSSCSPDFGTISVIDRFKQIEPRILIAVDGYQYNGRSFDRLSVLHEIQQGLPTLQHTVLVPYLHHDYDEQTFSHPVVLWSELLQAQDSELRFEQVPFEHPLWVLYSSGTTGLPKAIVQGHGGILLEHLKSLALELDLKAGDRFFWFSTTSWMMWNFLVGGLLLHTTILLYDGSPAYPDLNVLWRFAQDSGMTLFGGSASYVSSCMKAGIEPAQHFTLDRLRAVGSTGSPLASEGFRWLYEHVRRDLWVASISGGTDVCSAFVTGSILLPVYAGELQGRSLGAAIQSFDEQGRPLIDAVGELVVTEPMPSMPLYFWNDPQMKRYKESYFSMYPGIWRHGDWVRITPSGSAVIYGRSDSTINRAGIRMGSSEIYRVVESLSEVVDSLVVGVELPHGRYYLPLFVVLRPGITLNEALIDEIRQSLRRNISPHHVPDEVIQVDEVPRTLSGKKLEVPIKKLLLGLPLGKAVSVDALSNPDALRPFERVAQRIAPLRQV